jgi:hypothetical protein
MYAGGIIGGNMQSTNYIIINNCYTTGDIGNNSGGISGGIPSLISKCYTAGNASGNTGYIIAFDQSVSTDNFSESKSGTFGWNVVNASKTLDGVPLYGKVGHIWTEYISKKPYELSFIGYFPISTENISPPKIIPDIKPSLGRTIGFTFEYGINAETFPAIISNKNYEILGISGGNPSSYSGLVMDINTCVVTIPKTTLPGEYILYARYLSDNNNREIPKNGGNDSSYNHWGLIITINKFIPCLTKNTKVLTPNGYIKITDLKINDLIITSGNRKVPIVTFLLQL